LRWRYTTSTAAAATVAVRPSVAVVVRGAVDVDGVGGVGVVGPTFSSLRVSRALSYERTNDELATTSLTERSWERKREGRGGGKNVVYDYT
jgi:hypothetical protein